MKVEDGKAGAKCRCASRTTSQTRQQCSKPDDCTVPYVVLLHAHTITSFRTSSYAKAVCVSECHEGWVVVVMGWWW